MPKTVTTKASPPKAAAKSGLQTGAKVNAIRTESVAEMVQPFEVDGARAEAALGLFHPITEKWFRAVFEGPTAPQVEGWPAIARGESPLILAPTGTGKTLAAFLWCLDKLMMRSGSSGGLEAERGCRVVYLSPLKAL